MIVGVKLTFFKLCCICCNISQSRTREGQTIPNWSFGSKQIGAGRLQAPAPTSWNGALAPSGSKLAGASHILEF